MSAKRVLVFESNPVDKNVLGTYFLGYDVVMVSNISEAFKAFDGQSPHLILINTVQNNGCGFKIAESLFEFYDSNQIPLIFLSDNPSLSEKQQAYALGAHAFISKPYDILDFNNSIKQALSTTSHIQELNSNIETLQGELDSSYSSVMTTQTSLSYMQDILTFVKASLNCNDFEQLSKLFFQATGKLGSSCIVQIRTFNGTFTKSDTGTMHPIEKDVINMSVTEKVTLFGKNRALFVWPNIRVLVRNIRDNGDYFSYLLDGADAAAKAINNQNELISTMNGLQKQNNASQERASELFKTLNFQLREFILSLGITNTLDLEDEDELSDMVDTYSDQITGLLKNVQQNNNFIKLLIEQWNKSENPPQPEPTIDDGVSFFVN